MAFDQSTRNFLQRTVTKCREILAGRWQAPTEGEFFRQLQEIYGISPDGVTAPMEVLAHLGDEDRETARVLRDTINHYAAGLKASGKTEKEARREAVMRVAREQAFTVLNRLAALRMAEERGIVLECVRKGTQSEGFQLFLQSAGNAYGSTSAAYRAYLQVIFDELARDLGVLFNRFDKSSLLFPRHEALEALLKELSGTGEANRNASYTPEQVASFWGEDETIGWIYQYYNDPAERKKMREESAAPRNSRELAVRNQFFTPRYVVEFLTDNTLGRIWYEMTKGQTRLAEQCRYLVRRPTEIFLAEGETAPETPDQEGLSQAELLKQPVYIPHRPLKDPREIRLLDPACGSMHFGLYAFDIFEAIYEEAWDNGSCPALQEAYPSKGEFLKDVPRLIIENNLHGIDIDPRATQIAALSLWLRAQKAWQQQKVPAADRPRVRRSNIVCAEPMPGSPEMLEEFVATLDPPLLGELVKTVFDKMQLAGEAGSLLKIEEEIRTAIDAARKEWLKQQDDLLTREDGSQEEFFDTAEQQVIDALRAYSEQADADSYQRRLFADDAARGFAFIDLCRKRYDAVVMNPPFGEWSAQFKATAKITYPDSYSDILAAFVERGGQMLSARGRVGAITSRTCFFLSSFTNWRKTVILNHLRPELLADLGLGVMDAAMVEAAAYVLNKTHLPQSARSAECKSATADMLCFRLLKSEEAACDLRDAAAAINEGRPLKHSFSVNPEDFRDIPNAPFAYWVSKSIRNLFSALSPLESVGRIVRTGGQTSDDFRYLRLFWECADKPYIGTWRIYAKGGAYSPFYSDQPLVAHWNDSRNTFTGFLGRPGRSAEQPNNYDLYFKPGITWPLRAKAFSPQIMPAGCIFTTRGPAILDAKSHLLPLLGLISSTAFDYIFKLLLGRFGYPEFATGPLQNLPLPQLDPNAIDSLSKLAADAWAEKRSLETANLTAHPFYLPAVLITRSESLAESIEKWADWCDEKERNFSKYRSIIDAIAFELYGFEDSDRAELGVAASMEAQSESTSDGSDNDQPEEAVSADRVSLIADLVDYAAGTSFGRWDIRYATGERQPPELPDPFDPLPVCPPGMLQNAEGLPAEPKDVRADYLLRISWPGILVDDENHPEDIVARVREAIEVIWKDHAEAIEQEACVILGVKTLRDYFRRPTAFFADHLKRYSKSRRQAPIYWPLSTKSGSYTLWLYYHHITPDTLYKCIQQFVEPKMKDVEQTILRLRTMLTANEGSSKERKQLEEAETLLDELKELHDELSLWAPKWKPNLNDGVLITACPLWRLFRLPKWRKDLETCWKKLERGDYDWAHLAYTLFPNRVREKCKTDRSIAIAHGLEDLCQVQALAPKTKRAKKQKQPSSEDALL